MNLFHTRDIFLDLHTNFMGKRKRKRLMDRMNPRYSKEVVAAESNVSRRAKGVLASKTNSYPRPPLSAVFFADNLLLAA